MKRSRHHLPWDLVISLAIALVGFGYVVQSFKRTLAVASPMEASRDRLANEGEFVDVGCLDHRVEPMQVRRESGPLRLKGKFCGAGDRGPASEELRGLRIRNLTTHTEATVVLRDGGKSFLTSDVGLLPGENRIEVEWSSPERKSPARWTARIYSP